MMRLDGPQLPPLCGGRARQLVIILHGYAANAKQVLWLAKAWGAGLPDAAFVAPNAGQGNLLGQRQWFPLTVRSSLERWRGVNEAAPDLERFIREQLDRFGLPEQACALAGFSQGSEMALHVGLRWPRQFAGILAYSGLLAGDDRVTSQIRSRPPVLLIHGDRDTAIPVEAVREARDTLEPHGVPVAWHISHGLGHNIDAKGAALGLRFLNEVLPS